MARRDQGTACSAAVAGEPRRCEGRADMGSGLANGRELQPPRRAQSAALKGRLVKRAQIFLRRMNPHIFLRGGGIKIRFTRRAPMPPSIQCLVSEPSMPRIGALRQDFFNQRSQLPTLRRQYRGLRKPNGGDKGRLDHPRIRVVEAGGNTRKSLRVMISNSYEMRERRRRGIICPLSNNALLSNADVNGDVGQPSEKLASKWKSSRFPRWRKRGSTWPVPDKGGNIPESRRGRRIHHPVVEKSVVKVFERTGHRRTVA